MRLDLLFLPRTPIPPVEAPSVRLGYRTLVSLALCAAAAAAAIAHTAIDMVGDYVLPADTYDHLHHASRELLSALALILAVFLAVRGLRICCEIGAINRTRLLRPVHRLREGFQFVLAAVSGSALLVPAMEWLDGRVAGVPVQQLDDAFGGSVLLGLATTLLCATAVSLVVYAVAQWLVSHRDSIAGIIETLLHKATACVPPSRYALHRQFFGYLRGRNTHALSLAKRGPPEIGFG